MLFNPRSTQGIDTMAQTGKEGAVSAAVEALRKAMVAGDGSVLDKLSVAELRYGHTSGRLENKAEFIETLAGGKGGFTAIELSDQTVNVVGDIALVRHVFNGTRRNAPSGEEMMKLSILTAWVPRQEQWKLLARQAARL